MINIRPEILEQIKQYIEDNPAQAATRTRNDEIYEKFLASYPKDRVKSLTIDEYCTGNTKNYPNNFSNWIEFGLKKCLGGYFGGGASPHLIYKVKDTNNIVKVPSLDVFTDEEALGYVLNLHDLIINCDTTKDISWLADDELLQNKLGLEIPLIMPDTRKLRVLCAYHPDDVVHVFSKKHIQQFILDLTHDMHLSIDENAISLSQKLKECWIVIKKNLGIDSELSIHGFMMFLYHYYEKANESSNDYAESNIQMKVSQHNTQLNQILYGPPGTGKTYETVAKAVAICDPKFKAESRKELKERYDELIENKQISFVTFHQSFSYEDFVEGIRATTNSGQIEYSVEDGIFKEICQLANTKETIQKENGIKDLQDREIWKMSLGDTANNDESNIYDECIANDYVLLGYGYALDYSECETLKNIEQKVLDNIATATEKDFVITAMNRFKNGMKQGDLIIITDGNRKFRAIAEITGDYFLLPNEERNSYRQARPVKWLRTFESSIPVSAISTVNFSQMTIYQFYTHKLKLDQLLEYVQPTMKSSEGSKNYVLIIDEINRGNIANIFGELITLLEPSKRAGNDDARSVILPYSKESFSVPNNLYVIGTMNTSDHSLTKLDLALRRRFEFVELLPDYQLLEDIEVYGVKIQEMLQIMNDRIEVLLGRDYLIGHSYFLPLKDAEDKEQTLAAIFQNKIIPLLQEYFFEDWERIQWVLNDQNKKDREQQFIHMAKDNNALKQLFGHSVDSHQMPDRRYQINADAFNKSEAYRQILMPKDPSE